MEVIAVSSILGPVVGLDTRSKDMLEKTLRVPENVNMSDIDNIRELMEMLMSEHTPAKHQIKMKTNFGWEPPMDVFDTDTEFVVIMDIAGMDRKDI